MGNGKGLTISHTGNSFLPSSSLHKHLHLNNVLHVPSITENLISVSKLTKDINVYLEFHLDRATRAILLVGKHKEGFYS